MEMNKFETLLNILDSICNSAPEDFKSYFISEKSEEEINQIRSKAFIHLYLLVKFGLEDFKNRHDLITDGRADGGLDAYYIDSETKMIYLISQGLIPRSSAARQTNDERSESRADTPQLCCGEFHYSMIW